MLSSSFRAPRLPVAAVALCLSALSGCSSDPAEEKGKVGDAGAKPEAGPPTELFSFFVTSQRALEDLSGSQSGFGGDFRFGETGQGAGLRGADKLCAAIADRSMPGASKKGWRAFLSASAGEDGAQVDAIDRVGEGPWYDRLGRVFAASKADLVAKRPPSADPAIVNDLPNEDGVPNHAPDPTSGKVDNHDVLTGSDTEGRLFGETSTCLDWTTSDGAVGGRPRVGHSWPRDFGPGGIPTFEDGGAPVSLPPFFGDGGLFDLIKGIKEFDPAHWISSLDEAGCGAGANIVEMGPPDPRHPTVGNGGGYGGFYCFALLP